MRGYISIVFHKIFNNSFLCISIVLNPSDTKSSRERFSHLDSDRSSCVECFERIEHYLMHCNRKLHEQEVHANCIR